ncbi:MAG: AAA family ATPase [Arcicella sp.]|nr:AAA family ATPase [Arcicella sp.]
MTKTEEIRLHNLFIKFKNEGKGTDEIKGLLEVEERILEEWDKGFENVLHEAKERFGKQSFSIDAIFQKDNGSHYRVSPKIEYSQLEEIKTILSTYKYLEVEENIDKKILSEAQKAYSIFEKYFTFLEYDNLLYSFNPKYTLNTEDEKIKKSAEEAIEFYAKIHTLKMVKTKISLIKSISQDYYSNANKILPYALKSLKIEQFEGIKKTGFEGLPIDTNWVFLIGENSYGKTTILKSISLPLIDTRESDEIISESELKENLIGVEYFNLSKSVINNLGENIFTPLPHLACYGASRLQIQTDQTENDVAKKSTTTYSLFNSDGILLNIELEMKFWFYENKDRFEKVKKTFIDLIPYLSDIQVDVPQRKIFYIEKEPVENGSQYNRVTFNQLASGFRSILAMVGDMMIRLFKSQPEITEPSELAGIVIIDELDLHWHPKMQREIPSLLSSIFPKVQFIASTHSLVPLLGAPENSVLLKVNRTVKEGITVEKVDIDFQALSSDTMLRDIFDLEEYMSDPKIRAWERYKELKRLIRAEESTDKKEIYMDERREIGNKYTFPA